MRCEVVNEKKLYHVTVRWLGLAHAHMSRKNAKPPDVVYLSTARNSAEAAHDIETRIKQRHRTQFRVLRVKLAPRNGPDKPVRKGM